MAWAFSSSICRVTEKPDWEPGTHRRYHRDHAVASPQAGPL